MKRSLCRRPTLLDSFVTDSSQTRSDPLLLSLSFTCSAASLDRRSFFGHSLDFRPSSISSQHSLPPSTRNPHHTSTQPQPLDGRLRFRPLLRSRVCFLPYLLHPSHWLAYPLNRSPFAFACLTRLLRSTPGLTAPWCESSSTLRRVNSQLPPPIAPILQSTP